MDALVAGHVTSNVKENRRGRLFGQFGTCQVGQAVFQCSMSVCFHAFLYVVPFLLPYKLNVSVCVVLVCFFLEKYISKSL